jgi:hypothetical protein
LWKGFFPASTAQLFTTKKPHRPNGPRRPAPTPHHAIGHGHGVENNIYTRGGKWKKIENILLNGKTTARPEHHITFLPSYFICNTQ